jgi:hypothetical protein
MLASVVDGTAVGSGNAGPTTQAEANASGSEKTASPDPRRRAVPVPHRTERGAVPHRTERGAVPHRTERGGVGRAVAYVACRSPVAWRVEIAARSPREPLTFRLPVEERLPGARQCKRSRWRWKHCGRCKRFEPYGLWERCRRCNADRRWRATHRQRCRLQIPAVFLRARTPARKQRDSSYDDDRAHLCRRVHLSPLFPHPRATRRPGFASATVEAQEVPPHRAAQKGLIFAEAIGVRRGE